MQVIQAGPGHLEVLVPLFDGYRQFYGQPTNLEGAREFLAERLERGESVIFLALSDSGEGLGFTQLYPTFSSVSMRRLWILNDLFVAPTARKLGVGQALMRRARAFALETQAKGLTLQTAVDNLPAQALYESLGWRRESEFYTYKLDF